MSQRLATALGSFALIGGLAWGAPPPTKPATSPAVSGPALSADEKRFADEFMAAVNAHDAGKASAMIDRTKLGERVIAKLSVMPRDVEHVKKAILEDHDEDSLSALWDKKSEGTKLSTVYAAGSGDNRRIIFRMQGDMIEYCSVTVQPDGDHVVGVDYWSPYRGEQESEVLRFSWLMTIQNAYSGAVESQAILAMIEKYHDKGYDEVVKDYDGLDDSLKKNKWAKRLRFDAASHIGNEEAIKVGEETLKDLPNDPQLLMYLQFAYANEKRTADQLHMLEGLSAIYRDPAIEPMKVKLMMDAGGDPAQGIKMARGVLAKDPKNAAMLDLWMDSAEKAEDWPELLAAVAAYEKATGQSAYDLIREGERFHGFRRTKEGRQWLADQKKKQPPK